MTDDLHRYAGNLESVDDIHDQLRTDRDYAIHRAYQLGLDVATIAQVTGLHRVSIYRILREMDIGAPDERVER